MPPRANGGKVTFFKWTAEAGLVESSESFTSLDELFARCLGSGAHGYVEEVTIIGTDDCGDRRQVTLTFRAVTQPTETSA